MMTTGADEYICVSLAVMMARSSHSYHRMPMFLRRIVETFPGRAKIMTTIRDPVDRILSAYEFAIEVRRQRTSAPIMVHPDSLQPVRLRRAATLTLWTRAESCHLRAQTQKMCGLGLSWFR